MLNVGMFFLFFYFETPRIRPCPNPAMNIYCVQDDVMTTDAIFSDTPTIFSLLDKAPEYAEDY